MNPKDVRHNAVNWEFGMLVAPEHFCARSASTKPPCSGCFAMLTKASD